MSRFEYVSRPPTLGEVADLFRALQHNDYFALMRLIRARTDRAATWRQIRDIPFDDLSTEMAPMLEGMSLGREWATMAKSWTVDKTNKEGKKP